MVEVKDKVSYGSLVLCGFVVGVVVCSDFCFDIVVQFKLRLANL